MGRQPTTITFAFSLIVAVTTVACFVEPTEGEHDELLGDPSQPEPGVLYARGLTVDQAAFSYCSTAPVAGLSRQLIDEINCMQPGTMADISGVPGVSTSTFASLQAPAATALAQATAGGGTIQINSALRTTVQQYVLYSWYLNGRCTHVVSLAARPGRSNHESGLALDVGNYGNWRTRLEAQGFDWFGNGDPVHFDYVGGGGVDLRSMAVRAFQRLYNRNNPGAAIGEDGVYGPQTGSAIGRAPADGFALGASCDGGTGEPPPVSDVAIEVYWARQADGHYELRALAPDVIDRVDYVVDDYVIARASRDDGPNFPARYTFTSGTNQRRFEVRGYDADGNRAGTGVGLLDVTPGTAVYIKQMGESLYEIGLERAPAGVFAIEVRADGYLLTDSVNDQARSTRNAVRSHFNQLGSRSFRITTYNADGSVRGNLYRAFTLQ